jgi:alpha-tubulin suppressor-like RCC1 family protein
MKAIEGFRPARALVAVMLAALCLAARLASADTVNAVFNSATDVPVTTNSYTATSNTVNFTLNYAPATGTDLMVVKNTGLDFIVGTFDNLAQGQAVALSYGGVTYRFVANYYGGSGNDLVLVWASNRAFAWGYNYSGQLGDNTGTDRRVPVPATVTDALAGKTVVAMAAGGYDLLSGHSLALCSDGTVAAWGCNNNGELGNGTWYRSRVPVAVNTASGISVLNGKTVVAIAAGYNHSLALCSDGSLAAWGYNQYGQLGDNTSTNHNAPVAVNTAPGISALNGKTVVAIAAGYYHSLAVCSDGTVAAWGRNNHGELGDNSTTSRQVPVAVNTNSGVSALYGKPVAAVAGGWDHSLALCSDGTVAAWGRNVLGQLGDNTTTDHHAPVAVNTATGVSVLSNKTAVAIGAGGAHSLAQCSNGTLAAWGDDQYGELGDNTTVQYRAAPVAVNTNSGVSALYGKTVVAIAVGATHNLALCSDGTLAGWGFNAYGQLGDNTSTNHSAPVAVNRAALAASQRFTRVASGSTADHTLALVAAPPASQITLTSASQLTNGGFQFAFTNTPGAFFGVLAATNPALPLSNWMSLTGLTELSPGQFQFTDPQATNNPGRFYRVRSPSQTGLFKAGGGAGFRGEPFIEGGLAFHDQHAGGHRVVGVAAELGAVDLVAAFFGRREPYRYAHTGNGVLGHAHGDDFERVDDVFGADVTYNRFVHRHVHFPQPGYLEAVLAAGITGVETEEIGGTDKAHVLPAELAVLAGIERVPVELLADDMDHRGLSLVGKLINSLGP